MMNENSMKYMLPLKVAEQAIIEKELMRKA